MDNLMEVMEVMEEVMMASSFLQIYTARISSSKGTNKNMDTTVCTYEGIPPSRCHAVKLSSLSCPDSRAFRRC